ncbi:MAG: rhamnulokinase [Pseudonocardiaceae bacterium]|nr:rhamnulokinase [Pseudonocardiaceae bacterium]
MATFVAVDLGATSGRVMLGRIPEHATEIELTEVHRFGNGPVERQDGGLRWDVTGLFDEILTGLRGTAGAEPISVGVDSWAVDYGLLDPGGKLDGDVRCHRDPRTDGMAERLRALVDDETLYRITGLQYLPFNTIYQLLTEPPERLVDRTLLLLPDLLGYWLTGAVGAEVTNASTTALLDATTREWSADLVARAGLPSTLLPPLRRPGEKIGPLHGELVRRTGLDGAPVLAVASHDTASAVAAVPAAGERFGYISCGTWSLVGVELDAPVLTESARLANFTNEAGIDGTVRFLRNTMGLWLLSESLRTWGLDSSGELERLLHAAADEPAFTAVVDPDDPVFLTPGDMPARIADACRRTGQPVPERPAAVVRTILESLAMAHAAALHTAARLSGRELDVVHLVGGGARNELLCQLTADACGLPVLAGPVEPSALGNILVQARAAGVLEPPPGSRPLAGGAPLATYHPCGDQPAHQRNDQTARPRGDQAPRPRGDQSAWRAAADRVGINLAP